MAARSQAQREASRRRGQRRDRAPEGWPEPPRRSCSWLDLEAEPGHKADQRGDDRAFARMPQEHHRHQRHNWCREDRGRQPSRRLGGDPQRPGGRRHLRNDWSHANDERQPLRRRCSDEWGCTDHKPAVPSQPRARSQRRERTPQQAASRRPQEARSRHSARPPAPDLPEARHRSGRPRELREETPHQRRAEAPEPGSMPQRRRPDGARASSGARDAPPWRERFGAPAGRCSPVTRRARVRGETVQSGRAQAETATPCRRSREAHRSHVPREPLASPRGLRRHSPRRSPPRGPARREAWRARGASERRSKRPRLSGSG